MLRSPSAAPIGRLIEQEVLHVPAHFDAEILAALRREVLSRRVALDTALRALLEVQQLVATRHAITGMLLDAMALRDRFGGHDVFFALLARQLDATLVTSDRRLAGAAEGYVRVRFFP